MPGWLNRLRRGRGSVPVFKTQTPRPLVQFVPENVLALTNQITNTSGGRAQVGRDWRGALSQAQSWAEVLS